MSDEKSEDGTDVEECEDPLDGIHEWACQPFLPIFRDIPPLDPSRKYTLEDCLYANELQYFVEAVEDKLIPMFIGKVEGMKNHFIGAKLPPSASVDYSMFNFYHPSEIYVPIDTDSTSLPGMPRQVFVKGHSEPSFFKTVYAGDEGITLKELKAYSKIHAAGFGKDVRTSRLHGVVRDKKGFVMGLLLSYIDCGGSTLNCIDGSDPEYSQLREKWFEQVSHTLKKLHEHGIVWGDAKAANVLLDEKDDAYLVDFGGGYTKGWVEKEKSKSIEGDLQGLENIKRYLFDE